MATLIGDFVADPSRFHPILLLQPLAGPSSIPANTILVILDIDIIISILLLRLNSISVGRGGVIGGGS
ncbi:hypothetical protein NKR23_g10844 [Pleurostoma richardsiae]|uniref:Uncharacterized protein n=1 Tax=Pleurostoma richardsiae TaxID=41990 RepID=A0AA38RC02_9PEZI|nr:hypothetical protein NKR23_g10844 [Pleurostoma richardsiae]